MIKDEQIDTLKVKELDEEIALYDEAGYPAFDAENGEDKPKVPKDREGKIKFLKELRNESKGFPKRITDEDLVDNPELVGQVDVDDVIIVPFIEESLDDEEVKDKVEEKEDKPKDKTKIETEKPVAKILYYRGVQVLSSCNEVVNGKLYKKVNCVDASYLLSEDEFNSEVK